MRIGLQGGTGGKTLTRVSSLICCTPAPLFPSLFRLPLSAALPRTLKIYRVDTSFVDVNRSQDLSSTSRRVFHGTYRRDDGRYQPNVMVGNRSYSHRFLGDARSLFLKRRDCPDRLLDAEPDP